MQNKIVELHVGCPVGWDGIGGCDSRRGPSKYRSARRVRSRSPRSFRVSPGRAALPLSCLRPTAPCRRRGSPARSPGRCSPRHSAPEVTITFRPGAMVSSLDERMLAAGRRNEWLGRLRNLGDRAGEAARRRQSYGMHALKSYRANDPTRPTVCLIHGLNSSSAGFVHVVPLLEEAGYGIVVYDYPYNRSLDESCTIFTRDWAAFRRETQDRLPWSIVRHSMGALLARALIEDDATWAGDVSSLIMIAPVNQGSQLAKVQTIIQISNGLKAINGKDATKAMLSLSDGLGQAAEDMLPGKRVPEGAQSPAAPRGRCLPHPGWRSRLLDRARGETRSKGVSTS